MLFTKVLALVAAAVSVNALSSTLQQMSNFGTNPSNVAMYHYTVKSPSLPQVLIPISSLVCVANQTCLPTTAYNCYALLRWYRASLLPRHLLS